MAMQYFGGSILYPDFDGFLANAGGGNSILLDSANESVSFIFKVPKNGNISKLGFRTTTVNTGGVVDVRLETVNSDGLPTGTLAASSTNLLLTIADVQDNTFFTVTLGSAYVAATSTYLAGKVLMNATSAGSLNLTRAISNALATTPDFPYIVNFLGGVTTRVEAASTEFYIEYADGSTVPMKYAPASTTAEPNFSNTSNPDQRGNQFTLPFRASVCGAYVSFNMQSGGTFDVVLYDTDGTTALQSNVVNILLDPSDVTIPNLGYFIFDSSSVLQVGQNYILAVKPTSATTVEICTVAYMYSVSCRRKDSRRSNKNFPQRSFNIL